jgi:hypothetical protein
MRGRSPTLALLLLAIAACPGADGRSELAGRTASPPARPITDARQLAAARALLSPALGLPPGKLKVTLRTRAQTNNLDGEARDGSGRPPARFTVGLVDGKLALLGLATDTPPPLGGKPMGQARADVVASRLAATLYPRWRGRHMVVERGMQIRSGPSAAGGVLTAVDYSYDWTETPQPDYRTRNQVRVTVHGTTGRLAYYSCSSADTPLKYPRVRRAQAQRVAEAEVGRHRSPRARTRITLKSAYCLLGWPKHPPVWFFNYELRSYRPDGLDWMESGVSISVNGLTGALTR